MTSLQGNGEMEMRLQNKVAVITGAAGNIGLQAARAFVDEGASVMMVDLDAAALEKARAGLDPARTAVCVADVTRAEDVAAYAEAAVEAFGPIDVFFNNAGIEGPVAPITDYPEDAFQKVMAVNVFGVFLGMKYVIPKMRDGGSIIVTSSTAGLTAAPALVGYSTSKHAVVGIARSAAIDSAARGIRVNTVHPAMVESEMVHRIEEAIAGPDDTEAARKSFLSRMALGRYVTPQEVIDMVVFLASDESRMVTGSQFVIDAGYMIS